MLASSYSSDSEVLTASAPITCPPSPSTFSDSLADIPGYITCDADGTVVVKPAAAAADFYYPSLDSTSTTVSTVASTAPTDVSQAVRDTVKALLADKEGPVMFILTADANSSTAATSTTIGVATATPPNTSLSPVSSTPGLISDYTSYEEGSDGVDFITHRDPREYRVTWCEAKNLTDAVCPAYSPTTHTLTASFRDAASIPMTPRTRRRHPTTLPRGVHELNYFTPPPKPAPVRFSRPPATNAASSASWRPFSSSLAHGSSSRAPRDARYGFSGPTARVPTKDPRFARPFLIDPNVAMPLPAYREMPRGAHVHAKMSDLVRFISEHPNDITDWCNLHSREGGVDALRAHLAPLCTFVSDRAIYRSPPKPEALERIVGHQVRQNGIDYQVRFVKDPVTPKWVRDTCLGQYPRAAELLRPYWQGQTIYSKATIDRLLSLRQYVGRQGDWLRSMRSRARAHGDKSVSYL